MPQAPLNLDKLISLKVDNLPRDVVSDDLRVAFEKFGTVADVYIPMDFRSRMPKSFGFVRFTTQDDADAAVREMAGFELRGSRLDVQIALHPRPDRSSRRSRRSRSRSRSYRRRSPEEYRRSSRRSRSPEYRRPRSRSPGYSRSRY
jgi:RNA recognition motif-containing protein